MGCFYPKAFTSMLALAALSWWGSAIAQTSSERKSEAARPTTAQPEAASAEQAQTLYALGVLISRNLNDFALTPQEFERVKSGLIDGFNRRATQVDLTVDTPKIQSLRRQRMASLVDKRIKDGQAYLDKAAALPGARRTASGTVIVPIKKGSGASPTKDAAVLVRYVGKLIDGTIFDTAKNEPASFSLNAVIPCWSEVLPLMRLGETSRILCPPNLAYGLRGEPPKIPSQSTLDFEVELVAIVPASAASASIQTAPTQDRLTSLP